MSSPATHFHLRTETRFVSEKLCNLRSTRRHAKSKPNLTQSVTDRRKNRLDLTFPLLILKFLSSNPIFYFGNIFDGNIPTLGVKIQKYPVVIE